ncbi:MAG: hypothetical protein K0R53_3267 [Burkholderiales bacterium]|jgi:hypothetical protein|nr:hypothetical protein [Burkholderiales bacterium]
MTQTLTEIQLAAALGISVRHLRRLAARGMPVTCITTAKAWRERNVAGRAMSNDLLAARTLMRTVGTAVDQGRAQRQRRSRAINRLAALSSAISVGQRTKQKRKRRALGSIR